MIQHYYSALPNHEHGDAHCLAAVSERHCCAPPPQTLVPALEGKRDVKPTDLMYLRELIPSPDVQQVSIILFLRPIKVSFILFPSPDVDGST